MGGEKRKRQLKICACLRYTPSKFCGPAKMRMAFEVRHIFCENDASPLKKHWERGGREVPDEPYRIWKRERGRGNARNGNWTVSHSGNQYGSIKRPIIMWYSTFSTTTLCACWYVAAMVCLFCLFRGEKSGRVALWLSVKKW